MSKIMKPMDFTFGEKAIRVVGTDRDLWFVAKDVCDALGVVWKGSESISILSPDWIGVRKLRTPIQQRDGSVRLTEVEMLVINEAGLYKLAFRSNKPSADAFTNWVASEVLPSIRKTGSYTAKKRAKYLAAGKTEEWVEAREEGVEKRKEFTDTLKEHGVEGRGYAACTNAIYQPLLGGSASAIRVRMDISHKKPLRDSLSTTDLARVKFAEMLATNRIEQDSLQGNEPCKQATRLASEAVAAAERIAMRGQLGSPATAPPTTEK